MTTHIWKVNANIFEWIEKRLESGSEIFLIYKTYLRNAL